MNTENISSIVSTRKLNESSKGKMIFCKMFRRSFTLIELLVVIAIIAILAAMLQCCNAASRVTTGKSCGEKCGM